jgi:hypothetical protein
MADVDVTITVASEHADLIALALTTPDPPDLRAKRLNLYDGVTGTAIPIQNITFP